MKKKRFLRLVMAYGFQRNEAEQIAAHVGEFGSYEALFGHYRYALIWRPATLAFRRIGKATVAAARGIRDVFAAVFGGIDIAAGEDRSVVVHHARSGSGAPSVQEMTQEEHEAAHAAGRSC